MLPTKKNRNIFLTLYVIDPDDITKTKAYYPNTLAKYVILRAEKGFTSELTLDDHVHNLTKMIHVNKDTRKILRDHEVNTANGLLQLNGKARIPFQNTNPEMYAIYVDFKNIKEMLSSPKITTSKKNRIVMVADASDDKRPRYKYKTNQWCLYRYNGGNPSSLDSYERIMTAFDMDRVFHWDEFTDATKATVEEIDKMVKDEHFHFHKDVLDNITVDSDGKFYYKKMRILFRDEFKSIVISDKERLSNDAVTPRDNLTFLITGTEDNSSIYNNIDGPLYKYTDIEGNCDEKHKDDTRLVISPAYRTNLVTSANSFFENCTNLSKVMWMDTSNITNMNSFYKGCTKLTTLPDFDYGKVESANSFAENCTNLVGLDKIYFPSVKEFYNAFYNDNGIKKIDKIIIGNKKDLHQEISMDMAFSHLTNLTRISNDIELYNIKSAIELFSNNINIEKYPNIIITGNNPNISGLFKNNTKLKRIESIDFNNCTVLDNLFDNCPLLEYINIKNLHTDISFQGTNLSLECIKEILNNLDKDNPYTIQLYGIQAMKNLDGESLYLIKKCNWKILY